MVVMEDESMMLRVPVKIGFLLAAISAFSSVFLGLSQSASAITISRSQPDEVQDIRVDDIGKSFTLFFGGNVDGRTVSGLTSEATFTLGNFRVITQTIGGKIQEFTEISLNILLENTSTGNINNSRVSGLGFNISQDANIDVVVSSASITGNGSSTPIFASANLGDRLFAGGVSSDLCFSANQNNCRGGQNGGVTINQEGSFSTTFRLQGNVNKFMLSNFGVRYQSIDLATTKNNDDKSGTGYAVKVMPNGSHYWAEAKDSHLW